MIQKVMGIETLPADITPYNVSPVILHWVVSPDTGFVPLLALGYQKSLPSVIKRAL